MSDCTYPEHMSEEGEICWHCCGLGRMQAKPEQLGWLRRPELERESEKHAGVMVYEKPDGMLYTLGRPWRLEIWCPWCRDTQGVRK